MKITYAKIVNSDRIFKGTDLTEIELDFANNTSPIIMVLGGNGKGKSSILKHLVPTCDKSLFIEGKPGSEEIHINDKNDNYIIKHNISPTGKVSSTLEKNGEQLNKNGGVRTFEALIKEHLNFDQQFFKFGFLGSEIGGFIEEKASDRKKLIAKFIPNLDRYFKIYEICGTQITYLKKQIAACQTDLEKFADMDKIQLSYDSLKKQHTELNQTNQNLSLAVGANNNIIKTAYTQDHIDAIETELELLNQSICDSNALLMDDVTVECVNNKFISSSKVEEELQHDTNQVEKELAVVQSNIGSVNAELAKLITSELNISNKLKSKQNLITQAINDGKFASDLRKQAIVEEENIANVYHKMGVFDHNLRDVFDNGDFEEMFKLVDIESKSVTSLVKYILDNKDIISAYVDERGLKSRQTEFKNKLDSLTEKLSSLDITNSRLKSEVEQAKCLDQRPDDCNNRDCSFIKHAVPFESSWITLKNNQIEVENLTNERSCIVKEYDELNKALAVLIEINVRYEAFNNHEIYDPSCNFVKFIKCVLDGEQEPLDIFVNIVPAIIEFNKYYNTHKNLTIDLHNINRKLINLKDTSGTIASLELDITGLEQDRTSILEEISSIKLVINKLTSSESNYLIRLKELHTERVNASKATESYADQLSNQKSVSASIDGYMQSVDSLNEKSKLVWKSLTESALAIEDNLILEIKLGILNKEENTLSTEMDKLRGDINRHEYVLKTLENHEKQYNTCLRVRKTCHPTEGIPLLFINKYLQPAKKVANMLLDTAYGGQFNIDFKVDQDGFKIPVYGNSGFTAEDITKVSSGQRVITKSALCLGLIDTFIGRYNILCLDELDGPLDDGNRLSFLDIINKQIEVLGLEQVFVISHNEEFLNQPNLGLILFPKHKAPLHDTDFMKRSNVIAQF